MKKISIIIPVYNTEKHLEKCIRSVLEQTYRNIEIICVDDGSVDRSGEILDAFAEKDDRIKVIHKKNAGVSAARNDGLRIATGDWIGFVDSDDYLVKDMYESMIKANEKQEADIVACGYYLEYENICVEAVNMKKVPTEAISTKQFLKYIYERDNYKGVASYLWTRILSRELLFDEENKLKYEFSTEFDVSEDLVFLAEVMQESKKSLYIETPMYHYLQRESSACHDERMQIVHMSWVKAYLRIVEIFEQRNIEKEVYNLVVRMLVYRCGKFMEIAIRHQERNAYDWLMLVVEKYYQVYLVANAEYPERVEWLDDLMRYEWDE